MIFEGILNVFKFLALFIISLMPTFPDFSDALSTGLDPFFDVLFSIGAFVDLGVLSTCLVILFVVMNIDFIFAIIMWIVRKIPGVS